MNSGVLTNSLAGVLPAPGVSQKVSKLQRRGRFTKDGDETLERHLRDLCSKVATGVRGTIPGSKLQGLLLAGGYGRGEGGVLTTNQGDAPYNDLEFYVFAKGSSLLNERRHGHALHELGERLSVEAGLEVEFKLLSLPRLRSSETSMFSYDFVSGHQWLVGNESLFHGCEHHLDATRIPRHEATRLLFNRCSGLLFSAERLKRRVFASDDADFVGRNLAKVQLALGDALLAARGQYHWSCAERHERLCLAFPDNEKLLQAHAAGVAFKLHPSRSSLSREELGRQHRALTAQAWLVWQKLESERLETRFEQPLDYITGNFSKCPEQPSWRNLLVNARAFGWGSLLQNGAAAYPRQRLYHALCVLLWGDAGLPSNLKRVHQELRTDAPDFRRLVEAYERLWRRFN